MLQTCKTCRTEKPIAEFEIRKDTGRPRSVCKGCIRIQKAEKYQKNRAAIIQKSKTWREANRDRSRELARKGAAKHKERRNETSREWAKQNRELAKARATAWRKVNRERVRAVAKKLRDADPERFRTVVRNRRAKLKVNGLHTADDVAKIWVMQNGCCNGCRCNLSESGYHVDHIVAVANGGSNGPENIQLLCPTCNISKGTKDMQDWKTSKGYT